MKNSRLLAGGSLLAALIAVTLWSASVQGQAPGNRAASSGGSMQNSRFLLYQGSFEIREDKSRTSTGLFKIDTATGRVWRYEQDAATPEKPSAEAKWVTVDQF